MKWCPYLWAKANKSAARPVPSQTTTGTGGDAVTYSRIKINLNIKIPEVHIQLGKKGIEQNAIYGVKLP